MTKMIKTKTEMFAQRMRLELNALTQQLDLLERWNEDDDQDEIMLDLERRLLERLDKNLNEMKNLQTSEWNDLFDAKQEILKAKAENTTESEEAEQNG